jgi:hypothetical protein
MVPYLAAAGHAPLRTTVFAELFYGGSGYAAAATTNHAEIRNARYKLIRQFSAGYRHPGALVSPCEPTGEFPFDELYDLERDPFEGTNLLSSTLSPIEQQNYDALLAELEQLRRPRGTLLVFGTPDCVGSNGSPTMASMGDPTIGASYRLDLLFGARSSAAELLLGGSATRYAGLPLPLELAPFGAGPGCVLRTSIQLTVPTSTDATGQASVSVLVPPDLSLVGVPVYHSWLIIDPAAPGNPLGLTVSNGAAAVIGI